MSKSDWDSFKILPSLFTLTSSENIAWVLSKNHYLTSNMALKFTLPSYRKVEVNCNGDKTHVDKKSKIAISYFCGLKLYFSYLNRKKTPVIQNRKIQFLSFI